MARRFDGLVVWVTGGGSGIGKALALELADRGAIVAVSGRREDKLAEVVNGIAARGGQALAVAADVSDENGLAAAVAKIVKTHGKLDVAVANAGFGIDALFHEITADQWRRQMEINVVGSVLTLQAALPEVRKTRGRLAVVSSVMGKFALARSSAYCASKYALVGICDALYQELHGTGVTITNILPGLVESDIARVSNDGVLDPGGSDHRPQKLMWKADRAARDIANAIHKRSREAAITGHGKFAAFAGQHLGSVIYPILARSGVARRG